MPRSATSCSSRMDVEVLMDDPASLSRTDTPLWDALQRAVAEPFPDATTQPPVHRRLHRCPDLPRARGGQLRRRAVLAHRRRWRVQPPVSRSRRARGRREPAPHDRALGASRDRRPGSDRTSLRRCVGHDLRRRTDDRDDIAHVQCAKARALSVQNLQTVRRQRERTPAGKGGHRDDEHIHHRDEESCDGYGRSSPPSPRSLSACGGGSGGAVATPQTEAGAESTPSEAGSQEGVLQGATATRCSAS